MRYEKRRSMLTIQNDKEKRVYDESDFKDYSVWKTTFGAFPWFSKDNAKMDKIAKSSFD
jgi:hypothetical protein